MNSELAVRTGPVRPWVSLSGHAIGAFFRNPMAAFFTVAFPLLFLIIVAALVGDERTPDGVPVAQYLVTPFAVFGMAQASFTVLAVDTAALRESGVLLRLRGAPVTAAAVIASRIAASLVAALLSLALVTGVGAGVYGVHIVGHKLPALLVTVVLGVACLCALGLALTSLTRTVTAAQAIAQGILIPLAFISDVFIVGADLPRVLDVAGSLLPLKHFARVAATAFEPGAGSGFSPGRLAVLAGWTVAGAAVAAWRFGWAPRGSSSGTTPKTKIIGYERDRLSAPAVPGRPGTAALFQGQVRHALRGVFRNALPVFFTIVFPVFMLILFPAVFGDTRVHGLPMAQYQLPGMVTYTLAVAGFVNLPEDLAAARTAGVVERLRGTPLPYPVFLGARIATAMLTGLAGVMLLMVTAVVGQDVRLDLARLLALLLSVVLGGLCFALLGLALVALRPGARSLIAITLGVLLPLCFVSEVFVAGLAGRDR
ncbi:ABC transporter permease [Actinoplanes sp. NPDC049265]|uniref:ABC transporter permease n=1 Tax=Actinoplanes sp. NPDC049265 TaxID=3363902 RepID=UPI00371A8394